MNTYSDQQLVREYLAHANVLALEELVQRYAPLIYRFVRGYTGNEDMAADITQETLVKAWKNLRTFDEAQSFRTWVYTIAKHTAIDMLRKKSALPFSVLEQGGKDFAESLVDETSAPLIEQLVAQEVSQHLASALAQLPPAQGSIIDLHVHGGLNFREISEYLKKPLNTVKSQYRRGLAALRKLL